MSVSEHCPLRQPDAFSATVSGSGKTTIPGPSSTDGAAKKGDPCVRWLFPALDGRLTAIPRGTTSLGRDEDNQVHLEGTQVSRRHAAIQREGAIFLIRDLGSRNGVFVDGNRISAAPLRQGSLLRIGEWIGVVTTDEKASGTFVTEVLPGYFAGPVLMPRLLPLERAALAELPVVIQGETGTGKEGAARLAHQWSGRRRPFLALNCAALPEQLAEGELFGYRKGAFTGADRANPGHLRSADGGTLFLDEVADLPLPLQAKLLRALEQREVLPLGESTPVKFDVHLVTATQAPLAEAVAAGRFRADLYARLDGMTIALPPLRERVEELPFLFMRFLSAKGQAPAVDATVIEALCRYDWPYNMRELDRLARQLWALHGDEPTLLLKHLPARITEPTTPAKVGPGLAELDSATVLTALRTAKGNIKLAAQSLGISRQRLYRMLEEAGDIDLTKLRDENREEKK